MSDLSIFIASPGDVEKERALTLQIVEQLQLTYSGRLKINAIFWERTPLNAAENPQKQLKRPSDCDVVVGILWSRLGTPPGGGMVRADGSAYESGTAYELEDALSSARATGNPLVLVYKKTASARELDLDDLEEANAQQAALNRFIEKWFVGSDGTPLGAMSSFESLDSFDETLTSHLTAIADERCEQLRGDAATSRQWKTSPFRGLEQYEASHAEIFFGRSRETSDVAETLCNCAQDGIPFVLLVGRSGSGKSSLAKAGVVPYFSRRRRRVVGVERWIHCDFRPSNSLGNLAESLILALREARSFDEEASLSSQAIADLATEPYSVLVSLLERTLAESKAKVLLVIDQLEEVLIDDRTPRSEVAQFFGIVETLANSGHVWVISTLRSDFYAAAVDYETLDNLKTLGGQYDVRSPSSDALRSILKLSTSVAGLALEKRADESLLDILHAATSSNRSALPLLGFMLSKLYERRSGNLLTISSYRELGELRGVIARTAESVYSNLETESIRAQLPAVLRELVTVDPTDAARFTRRRMQFSSIEGNSNAKSLVHSYLTAMLFTVGSTESGSRYVEITHEALLTHWPRATNWIEQNLDYLRTVRRVSEAASLWDAEGRSDERLAVEGGLYNDVRLVHERAEGVLETPTREFVAQSTNGFRKRMARKRGFTVALAALAIVASAASTYAFRAKNVADTARIASETTSDFLVHLFNSADPNQVYAGNVPARVALDVGRETVTSIGDDPEVKARLLGPIARAYTGLGRPDIAISLLTQEISPEQLLQVSIDNRFGMQFALGEAYLYRATPDNDGFQLAKRHFIRSDQLLLESRSKNLSRRSEVLVALGDVEAWDIEGNLTKAREFYEQALAIDSSIGDQLSIARDLNRIGYVSWYEGRSDSARAEFSEALSVAREELKVDDHLLIARYENDFASTLYEDGLLAQAEPLFEYVIDIYDRVFPTNNLESAIARANLGRVLIELGRTGDAREHLTVAYKSQSENTLTPRRNTSITLNNLALVAREEGRDSEAVSRLRESLGLAGDDSDLVKLQTYAHLAELEFENGSVNAALEHIGEAIRVSKNAYGVELREVDWRYAIVASALAEIELARCNTESAASLLETSSVLMSDRWSTPNIFTRAHQRRLELFELFDSGQGTCSAAQVGEGNPN